MIFLRQLNKWSLLILIIFNLGCRNKAVSKEESFHKAVKIMGLDDRDITIITDLDKCLSCLPDLKGKVAQITKDHQNLLIIVLSKSEKKVKIMMEGIDSEYIIDKSRIFEPSLLENYSITLVKKNENSKYIFSGIL